MTVAKTGDHPWFSLSFCSSYQISGCHCREEKKNKNSK